MLESIHFLRKEIISALSGQITINGNSVDVYNRIPTSANYPLIRVYSVSSNEIDQNQSSFIMETITRIECISRFSSDDGGELQVNQMVNQILNIVRSRPQPFDLSSYGFKVFTSVNDGVKYLNDDMKDHTYYRGIIELSNKVQQI